MLQFDVVTLGETMIRFSPPVPQRIEQAATLEVNVGGAESNVAVALARLGHKVAWLSRLPNNAWGRRIVSTLRAQGVDVSGVAWAKGERVGTYFVEYGRQPRPIHVIYDRADSAASRMQVDDVPWEMVENARVVHCTGITPALSPSCANVVTEVMRRARQAGALVTFDVNYRSLLWPPHKAGVALDAYCRLADIVFGAWRDVMALFGATRTPDYTAPFLRAGWGCKAVVLTLGDAGAMACDEDGLAHVPAFDVDIVDRLGAGDAFDAGFISAYMGERSLEECLRYGTALASLCMTIPSDLALVTPEEVEALLAQGQTNIQR